jgi:DNA-directed RNA polymerase specialized sigma24 family protein
LAAILRNTVARVIRGRKEADMAISLQAGSSQGSWVATSEPGAADLLVRKEERELLHEVLTHVNPDRSRRFRMRYHDDLPFDEIARREGMNTATVRKEIFRTCETVADGIQLLRLMERQRFVTLQRRALCLWFFQARRQAQIAAELGVPVNLVRHWIDDLNTRLILDTKRADDEP